MKQYRFNRRHLQNFKNYKLEHQHHWNSTTQIQHFCILCLLTIFFPPRVYHYQVILFSELFIYFFLHWGGSPSVYHTSILLLCTPVLTPFQRRKYQIGEFGSAHWLLSCPAPSSFHSLGTQLPSKEHTFCSARPHGKSQ